MTKSLKNNSAFTLVELLGIIIILAVIALITVPMALNLNEESKEKTFRESMNNLIKSANNYYASKQITINENLIFDFSNEGLNEKGEQLSFSGIKPVSGTVVITSTGNIHFINVSDGTYYANYDKDNSDKLEITQTYK